jgi:hypothetical protein
MKAYWGSESTDPPFYTSAQDRGKWSASLSGRFTTKEINPRTHWIGGSLGPRAGMDAAEQR